MASAKLGGKLSIGDVAPQRTLWPFEMTTMIKPWSWEFFASYGDEADHSPREVRKRFRDFMDLWVRHETHGFEGVFFSEHHFGSAYSPSPNLLISHLAALTSTLRLAVNGAVSAYTTPWRVVEEFAMLDHLTDGRLEVGLVSGIPPEYGLVNIAPAEAIGRHAEIMAVVEAWRRSPYISHQGEHWRFDDLHVLPRPFQPNGPPMWTAAMSRRSAERAGRGGWRLCGGFLSIEEIRELFRHHQAAAAANGHPLGPDELGIRRQVMFTRPGETRAAALERARANFDLIIDKGPKPEGAGGGPLIDEDETIVGSPEQVTEEIIRQCRIAGCAHFVAGFNDPDFSAYRDAHEVFAREVIPALRAASVEAPATAAAVG